MAPEQTGLRLGLGKVGPACDIHGVGAVLFAALTGRPPHEGETAMATLAHVAYEEAPWLRGLRADVPVDLATIVAKCLRPLPGERYRSAWELREDLDRFGRGEPILARSYTPREQVRNWIRRHPTLAVTVGLTGTLLVATALGATYHVTRLRQNFFLLQSKQSEVESALKQAELATESERELRSDTVRQVAVAHRVMLNSLRHTAAISDDNLKLLNLIRSFYHQQLETATQIDGELAEILGEGLMVLSELESRIVSRPAYAEQDSGLLLQLADRHPQSQALVSQRAHMLNIRWSLFRQQGRSAEAQQALEEITRLATRYAENLTEEPPPNLLPSLMGMLWNAGDLPRALQVVDAALQRERRRHASGNRPPESWQSLLALQSQRMGVMHELEWWPEAEATLLDWLRMSEKLQTVQPELEPVLTLGRLQMMGRHLQLAGEHLAGEQRESLLKSARALFTQLDRFATNPREHALIAMDWTVTLESLPAGTISDAELETTWEITRRAVARLGPEDIQGSLLVTSTSLRNRYATRALATGRFAEALQTARDGLVLWENWPDKTARQYRQQCVDLLDVAARACRALDRAAEELHYLSRAEQLAPETERNAWQARLQNATREQGLDWPGIAEPVTQPE